MAQLVSRNIMYTSHKEGQRGSWMLNSSFLFLAFSLSLSLSQLPLAELASIDEE